MTELQKLAVERFVKYFTAICTAGKKLRNIFPDSTTARLIQFYNRMPQNTFSQLSEINWRQSILLPPSHVMMNVCGCGFSCMAAGKQFIKWSREARETFVRISTLRNRMEAFT